MHHHLSFKFSHKLVLLHLLLSACRRLRNKPSAEFQPKATHRRYFSYLPQIHIHIPWLNTKDKRKKKIK